MISRILRKLTQKHEAGFNQRLLKSKGKGQRSSLHNGCEHAGERPV